MKTLDISLRFIYYKTKQKKTKLTAQKEQLGKTFDKSRKR